MIEIAWGEVKRRPQRGRSSVRSSVSGPGFIHSSWTAGECLSQKETEDLMAWMRNALGSRVTNVKVRPTSSYHTM